MWDFKVTNGFGDWFVSLDLNSRRVFSVFIKILQRDGYGAWRLKKEELNGLVLSKISTEIPVLFQVENQSEIGFVYCLIGQKILCCFWGDLKSANVTDIITRSRQIINIFHKGEI